MSKPTAVQFQTRRLIVGLLLIGLTSTLLLWVGKVSYPIIAFAAGCSFVFPIASLVEWIVHGFIYHSAAPGLAFINHLHNGHHWNVFPPKRYYQTETHYMHMRFHHTPPFEMADNIWDEWLAMYSQVFLHLISGMPIVLGLGWYRTRSIAFCSGVFITGMVLSWVVAYVHGVMHTPKERWVEKQGWFQWLDRHHYLHHIDVRVNVNFFLPICDALFGSLRTEMTADERKRFPPFEAAKPVAWDVKHTTLKSPVEFTGCKFDEI